MSPFTVGCLILSWIISLGAAFSLGRAHAWGRLADEWNRIVHARGDIAEEWKLIREQWVAVGPARGPGRGRILVPSKDG